MANRDLEVLELKPPTVNCCTINNSNNEITRLSITELSYNYFYWQYMERNYPVILKDVSTQWECRLNWLKAQTQDLTLTEKNDNKFEKPKVNSNIINYDYLREKIGNCQVPVANCNREYFNSHAKCEMLFYDFLHYWQEKQNDLLATTTTTNLSNNDNKTTTTGDLLYLKDWHLKAQNAAYDFYKVPKYFASDWLNEHLIATKSDDYRFVYMGPKDTWTPFHSDVFGSFSWSTNIMGIKKWLLLPPGEELKLSDHLGNLPFCINEEMLEKKYVKYFIIMQMENESIFVPSGWHHQVWNITDTISVNHNWFNACNLQRIWYNLNNQMEKVVKEIDDCRQMDNFIEHCQTMLRASFGLNYLDFLQLLECIANRRLRQFNNNTATANVSTNSATIPPPSHGMCSFDFDLTASTPLIFFDQFIPNDYHVRHDLERILQVVELMLQDSIICENRTVLYRKCIHLRELLSTKALSLSLNEKISTSS
ncbi:putative JmjC domain-containing protein 4 [Lucilia cuprina]|uniref:Jumonji domain-containing protein 4 n=1 Tax=Lucilia cuprina TaxID=7375 RepID=A0A0L0C9T1_LUCCU|nr:putative JmjC domain-containing protein 4 [Lucilia cuprina]